MEVIRYNVIGVMSGSSLDGIDLAYIKFTKEHFWKAQIAISETITYGKQWVESLKVAPSLPSACRNDLNNDYTLYLSQVIHQFIEKNNINHIDAICSHGHTIAHQPEKGVTFQIGNLPDLAKHLNIKVVCDFRVQDVQLGGQGAPLVPLGDQLLFPQYDYCLNLGGFANVSTQAHQKRIAFDICAVNTILNRYAQQLGKVYDENGAFAKAGQVNTSILEQLEALEFYKLKPPKSLGMEWVNAVLIPILTNSGLTAQDILATYTEHIARQISSVLEDGSSVLATGGGAYNTHLIKRISTLKKVELVIPENQLVEFKEALIFGLLGVLRLENKVNTLASVTGAAKDHSAGIVYLP